MLEIRNFTQNEIDDRFFQRVAEIALRITEVKNKTEISLAIVGDGRMRRLNKMYCGKNRVTDVLSFGGKSVLPYLTGTRFVEPPDGVKRLGEIIICYPQAKKQAKRMGVSLEKELTLLLIHGILHLLGYDHEEMGETEKEILKKINKRHG